MENDKINIDRHNSEDVDGIRDLLFHLKSEKPSYDLSVSVLQKLQKPSQKYNPLWESLYLLVVFSILFFSFYFFVKPGETDIDHNGDCDPSLRWWFRKGRRYLSAYLPCPCTGTAHIRSLSISLSVQNLADCTYDLLHITALATHSRPIVEPEADLTNLHRLIALHRWLRHIWIYLYENGMLVRDDLRTHLAPDLLSPACRTSSSRTPRPRKTFSSNDPGRICDTDAAPCAINYARLGGLLCCLILCFHLPWNLISAKVNPIFSKARRRSERLLPGNPFPVCKQKS